MAGNYSITTRATGVVLTASIYNADHQNHVTNHTPQGLDDYSADVTQMRLTADPGEDASESLSTDLAGEIARLRHSILEIKQHISPSISYWYETPIASILAPDELQRPILSLGTDAAHDIDISAGSVMDSTGEYILATAGITKQVDTTGGWVEGTNQAGRPVAFALPSVERSTVHVFLIGKTDGTVDAGFDSSVTAANLLAEATGYTLYRRIGSLLLDATNNWLIFLQNGNRFRVGAHNFRTSAPPLSFTAYTTGCPTGIEGLPVIVTGNSVVSSGGLAQYFIAENISGNEFNSYLGGASFSITDTFSKLDCDPFPVDSSGRVKLKSTVTVGHTSWTLTLYGWIDNLDLA